MIRTNLYLAYGSNLNLEQMKYRCPTAKVVGKTVLKNYKLVFRGSYRGGVATIEKFKNYNVPVLVWNIQEEDEKRLDRYEGYPTFYRKEYFNIDLKGAKKKAMVYIMNEGRKINCPSRYYLNTILDGYESANFDKNILMKAVYESYTNERIVLD